MFNEIFNFFIENKLISLNQSSFETGDSCINQLLSIAHEIYEYFDVGLEVKSVFLDVSKGFDKVWHDGVIYKLTQSRISGNLQNILEDFLKAKKTTRSHQGTSIYMGKISMLEYLKVLSLVLCCF